jgi:hypothetical protein
LGRPLGWRRPRRVPIDCPGRPFDADNEKEIYHQFSGTLNPIGDISSYSSGTIQLDINTGRHVD